MVIEKPISVTYDAAALPVINAEFHRVNNETEKFNDK